MRHSLLPKGKVVNRAFFGNKKAAHTPRRFYSWTASLCLVCGMRGL